MAFTILSASGSNLTDLTNLSTDVSLPVNYSLDTSKKFVICNHPEALKNDMYGDKGENNKCLNQVTVPAGTHQIFFSYQYNNGAGSAAPTSQQKLNFGIQIFNPNSAELHFKQLKLGHGTNRFDDKKSWDGVAGETIKDYFNSSPASEVSIAKNGSYWFDKELLDYSGLYSGLMEFQVDKQAIITVYIYKSKWNIDGTATVIPKTDGNGKQYSGYSNGYKYVADTITLNASDLQKARRYLKLNTTGISNLKINRAAATSDLLPIYLAAPAGKCISPSTSGQNLGNWGIIYEFPVRFVNDSGKSSVTFNIYMKTDTNDTAEYCVINSGFDTKYAHLKQNGITDDVQKMYNAWKCISKTVTTSTTETFRYVLGTNSCANKRLIFTVS
jgi:hypothetical protein